MKNIAIKTLIFIFLLSVCIVNAEKVLAQAAPLDAAGYYNLGIDYAEAGRYQEAIEAYKQAIKLEPDNASAHYNLGLTYLIIGDKGSTLKEYEVSKILDPERANKLLNFINT